MEALIIEKYKALYERAKAVGLILIINDEAFEFNIPGANGLTILKTLSDVETFIKGYEYGYKSK